MIVQQHSIRLGMALWTTGLAAVVEAALTALTGIGGILFVYFSALCPLSSGCLVYGAFVAAVAAMVSFSLGRAWAVRFSLFAFMFCF